MPVRWRVRFVSQNRRSPSSVSTSLANAARQLYHAKRGTLVGKAPVAEMNFAPGTAKPETVDENIPF